MTDNCTVAIKRKVENALTSQNANTQKTKREMRLGLISLFIACYSHSIKKKKEKLIFFSSVF